MKNNFVHIRQLTFQSTLNLVLWKIISLYTADIYIIYKSLLN